MVTSNLDNMEIREKSGIKNWPGKMDRELGKRKKSRGKYSCTGTGSRVGLLAVAHLYGNGCL